MTTATEATAATAEAAATSPASFPHHANGRADPGAAGARLQELYEQHARMARGLCRLLLRDAGEAEDATQQTFLSAYRALLGGALPREPAAWIATIARNECRSRIRTRMRTPLVDRAQPDEIPDPVDAAVRSLDTHALWRAIASLPPRQREAFLLRELGGLSYDELAVALGVTVPAIESLLQRARGRLRALLGPARTLVPSLGRLLPWPFAVKIAATTVGASLIAGGTPVHAVAAAHLERQDVAERQDTVATHAVVEPQDAPERQALSGGGGDSQDTGD